MNCRDMETQAVCMIAADGTQTSAIAHFEYGLDLDDVMLNASTRFTDHTGLVLYDPADFAEVRVGACQVRTHLIEGCITVDGEKVSAYTIVDDNGDPLFRPRPLTDTGLEDCC